MFDIFTECTCTDRRRLCPSQEPVLRPGSQEHLCHRESVAEYLQLNHRDTEDTEKERKTLRSPCLRGENGNYATLS